jgi:hypothetical protein
MMNSTAETHTVWVGCLASLPLLWMGLMHSQLPGWWVLLLVLLHLLLEHVHHQPFLQPDVLDTAVPVNNCVAFCITVQTPQTSAAALPPASPRLQLWRLQVLL